MDQGLTSVFTPTNIKNMISKNRGFKEILAIQKSELAFLCLQREMNYDNKKGKKKKRKGTKK